MSRKTSPQLQPPPLPSPLDLEQGGFLEWRVLFTVSYSLGQVVVVPWISVRLLWCSWTEVTWDSLLIRSSKPSPFFLCCTNVLFPLFFSLNLFVSSSGGKSVFFTAREKCRSLCLPFTSLGCWRKSGFTSLFCTFPLLGMFKKPSTISSLCPHHDVFHRNISTHRVRVLKWLQYQEPRANLGA